MIRLIVPKPWKHRDPKRGVQVLPAGEYSVPGDVSEALAERAVAEGMATSYRVRMPESVVVPVEVPQVAIEEAEPVEALEAEPVKKKRGRPRKGPAPENKACAAPENKAALY